MDEDGERKSTDKEKLNTEDGPIEEFVHRPAGQPIIYVYDSPGKRASEITLYLARFDFELSVIDKTEEERKAWVDFTVRRWFILEVIYIPTRIVPVDEGEVVINRQQPSSF